MCNYRFSGRNLKRGVAVALSIPENEPIRQQVMEDMDEDYLKKATGLSALLNCGVTCILHTWLAAFLSDRIQTVAVSGQESALPMLGGVP